MSDLILYTTEDGRSRIKLRADRQTVGLTLQGKAELFDTSKQNISLHLKNIVNGGEIDPSAGVKDSLTSTLDRSSYRHLPILYTMCRESPPSICVSNCQELLDGSNVQAVIGKWRPGHRLATRPSASVFVASLAADTYASSVTRSRQRGDS